MIKFVLGKYWWVVITGVAIQFIVIVTVLVRLFASTSDTAKWILDIIYNNSIFPFGSTFFSFVLEWAEVLSIVVVYIICVPIVILFMESRKRKALVNVNLWAREAIMKLTYPSRAESVVNQLNDWKQRLNSIIENSDNVKDNIKFIGNGLSPKVNKAVENVMELKDCINDYSEPSEIRELLHNTVTIFIDISNSTNKAFT